MSSQVVVVDLGASGINALEVILHSSTELPTILKAATKEIPAGIIKDGKVISPDELTRELKEFWTKNRFKSRKVLLMNTGTSYDIRKVRDLVGALDEGIFRTTLPSLIREKVPYEVDNHYLDSIATDKYYLTDRTGTPILYQEVAVVATEKLAVDSMIDILTSAKLIPVYMDVLPFCLLRAYKGELNEGDEDKPIISLDIGAEILTMQVHTNLIPEYTHTVSELGGKNITMRIAKEMNIREKEAEILKIGIGATEEERENLIVNIIDETTGFVEKIGYNVFSEEDIRTASIIISKEVTKIISYINDILRDAWSRRETDDEPYEIVLSGSSAKLHTFQERLSSELGIPVRILDPFSRQQKRIKKDASDTLENPLKYAPVYGLAIGIEEEE